MSRFKKKIREDYKEFADEKNENVNDENFYLSKWKRLFNQETLRIFFAKKVLFVEGIVDYILFNNILKEELCEELKDVEIIPIFGKFHYIFFYKLAEWLDLDYWFLLDEDKYKVSGEDGKEYWKKPYGKEFHINFWKKYGKDKVEEERNEIMHSKEENKIKISWIRLDLEAFLGIKDDAAEDKEYNLISKADTALTNLENKNFAKLNELKKIFNFLKRQKKA